MVDRDEVLRYLGYRGEEIDGNLEILINTCREEVVKKSNPRYIYGYFHLQHNDNEVEIKETILKLKGKDIKKHLKGCKRCAILIATLGVEIEKEIVLNEKSNLTKSIILDACATTYIEEVCDKAQDEIEEYVEKEKLYITSRFSPGYGDLPLSIQKDILSIMNSNRRVGVSTTEHSILFPRKSVTAIIGITEKEGSKSKKDCSKCNKYESCMFRRGGRTCND